MTPIITAHSLPGAHGIQVLVRLEVTDEEHALIFRHRMATDAIEIVKYRDRQLHFGDFYGGTHATFWDLDSAYQADLFIQHLKRGFKQFQWFLEQNRKLPGYEPPPKPWNFFDTNDRFAHTWIYGDSGTGKTTLLSALIANDLFKVQAGGASVLILDSQDEHLSNYLPRMADFGPGGDLEGKLVYLEPDAEHPLALNIVNVAGYHALKPNEQARRLRVVQDMLTFFIGTNFGVPSAHMRNIISYALRALTYIPNPTIYIFKELLVKGRLQNLMKEHKGLASLSDDAKRFLLTDLFNANYGPSREALGSRLDNFFEDQFTGPSFTQSENKLRLYDLLNEPRVVVVNTRQNLLGEESTSFFGRYILASLLAVVRRRTGGGLPCYVYIDEAQEYISQEESVIGLINEARRQKIALTFAHHRRSDIKSVAVAKALEGCAIHIRPATKKHHWGVQVRHGELEDILPPDVNFKTEPKMKNTDWLDLMDQMHARYCIAQKGDAADSSHGGGDMPDAI